MINQFCCADDTAPTASACHCELVVLNSTGYAHSTYLIAPNATSVRSSREVAVVGTSPPSRPHLVARICLCCRVGDHQCGHVQLDGSSGDGVHGDNGRYVQHRGGGYDHSCQHRHPGGDVLLGSDHYHHGRLIGHLWWWEPDRRVRVCRQGWCSSGRQPLLALHSAAVVGAVQHLNKRVPVLGWRRIRAPARRLVGAARSRSCIHVKLLQARRYPPMAVRLRVQCAVQHRSVQTVVGGHVHRGPLLFTSPMLLCRGHHHHHRHGLSSRHRHTSAGGSMWRTDVRLCHHPLPCHQLIHDNMRRRDRHREDEQRPTEYRRGRSGSECVRDNHHSDDGGQ